MFLPDSRLVLVRAALDLIEQRDVPCPTVLLGAQGVGKRIFARALAREMDSDFIELNMAMMSRVVSSVQDPVSRDSTAWDYLSQTFEALSQSDRLVIYLSNLEQTDSKLQTIIHTLITKNIVRGGDGLFRGVSEKCVVIGGYEVGASNANVSRDGWLLSGFENRIWLRIADIEHDLPALLEHFASQKGAVVRCACPAGLLAQMAENAIDGIEALRRWIDILASSNPKMSTVAAEDVLRAATLDTAYLGRRLEYRGRFVEEKRIQAWINQFPESLRPQALHVVREIATRYYIDDSKYYPALESLVKATGLPPNARVRFCRWQRTGQSAPRVAHHIKNLAGWRVLDDVDLDNPGSWPNPDSLPTNLILADDFVGSGGTLAELWRGGKDSLVSKLARKYRGGRLHVLVVCGYQTPIQTLRNIARQHGSFVSISVGIPLLDEDRCFTDDSRIFPREVARTALRQFCERIGALHFTALRPENYLGFAGVGALIAFADTVPNNTIPSIWYDRARTWMPLFPASGLLS